MLSPRFFGRDTRRRLAALLIALSTGVLPVLSAPASAATVTIPTPAPAAVSTIGTVSRGAFVKAAVAALKIPVAEGDWVSPGIPKMWAASVKAAYDRNALMIFGSSPDLRAPITRGEAASVLTELMGLNPVSTTVTYSDVKGSLATRAAAVAVQRQWLRPLRGKVFGWNQPLHKTEMQALIRKAAKNASITIPVTRTGTGASSDALKQNVWNILNQDFLYKDRLGTDIGDQSVESLVKNLKDPYTIYMNKTATENFNAQLSGKLEGIGATVDQTASGVLFIIAPLKGSPAEKAGLLPKDQILSVNGESLAGLSADEAVGKIRGPKGTVAQLHLRRNGTEMDITVTRDSISIPDVDITMQEGVAIVHIAQFGQATEEKFRDQMTTLIAEQKPRGIVVDLRNNPGGYLDAAGIVTSAFLPKNSPYVLVNSRDSSVTEYTEAEPVVPASMPLVLLVNKGSASAAEIVTGALQDAKRAKVVGVQTYGKGSVQSVVTLPGGNSVKVTIAEWKTPLDRKINGIGLMPDYPVENATTPGSADLQLLKALSLVQ